SAFSSVGPSPPEAKSGCLARSWVGDLHKMKPVLMLLILILACGCTSVAKPAPSPTSITMRPFLAKASTSEIKARAIAQAQEDIRRGTPHLARTGGRASVAWNVPDDKMHQLVGLPSVPQLPTGCSDPLLEQARTYAMAYNGELVKHLPLKGR